MKKILRACKLSFYKLLFTIKCFGKNKKKIFLFHVPMNSNMGDQAIIYAEKKFVKKYFPNCKWIEISYYLEDRAFEFIINKIKSRDLILIQGGGSLGDLYPKEEQIVENVLNNNSMVMKLNFGNFSMLFTGDIEKIAERDMINNLNSNILKSDVLKIAHHGSKTSTTDEFIRKVLPDIALIGVGKNNSFGHPSSEVIERLEKLNVKVYRTDQKGEIKIEASQNGKYFIDVHIK